MESKYGHQPARGGGSRMGRRGLRSRGGGGVETTRVIGRTVEVDIREKQ